MNKEQFLGFLKKNTMIFTIMVVEPTAARASFPTKLPTTMESTVL